MSLEYLKEECLTNRQRKVLDLYIEHDQNAEAVARKLNTSGSTVRSTILRLKKRAAEHGHAPEHWDSGVAPGYRMGKVTIQRGPEGVERVWERQHPDSTEAQEHILQLLKEFSEDLPIIDVGDPPHAVDKDLCTIYVVSDFHLGMLAWGRETGAPWDIRISSQVMKNAIHRMCSGSPKSGKAVLVLLGDFVHWDGALAVTPQHKNILDADIRYQKLQEASFLVIENAIEILSHQHEEVTLIQCEGNHDIASSSWLRVAMSRIFRKNDRVKIDITPFAYNAFLHGRIMLGFHHGHRKKDKELPAVFASEPRYRRMWGEADYTYVHTGHTHNSQMYMSEQGGAIVERHPTLAARDAFATGIGAMSMRSAHAITYHAERGEVLRVTVLPEYSPKPDLGEKE